MSVAKSTGRASEFPGLRVADVHQLIRAACEAQGSQAAWAALHGLSPSYLSDVLHMKRDPGPAILEALGLIRVVRYLPKPTADGAP